MHVRRMLVAAVVAPLVLGLGLSGCQEADPEPKMPETSASSPTPSPTETATAEQESPEDFIRRWARVNQAMQQSGDDSEFRSLSPECQACMGLADRVAGIYEDGGEIRWAGWRILGIHEYGKPAETDFRVEVRSAPTRYREAAGSSWKQLDGGQTSQLIKLHPRNHSWLVSDVVELSR